MNTISRRKFITISAYATASIILCPNSLIAKNYSVPIMRLHPVRFIAGLIFDVFRSVFVELAKDAIVSALYHGYKPKDIVLSNVDGMERAGDFKHLNYKASTVILGVSNYEMHKKRQLKILLDDESQKNNFQEIIDYLRDEKIRIKTAETEYSYPVGLDTDPDDLFILDYMQMESNQETHYNNLINITKSSIFTDWSV